MSCHPPYMRQPTQVQLSYDNFFALSGGFTSHITGQYVGSGYQFQPNLFVWNLTVPLQPILSSSVRINTSSSPYGIIPVKNGNWLVAMAGGPTGALHRQ
eukprot:SM004594S16141  [mRNA]  locus=s4594:6:525:- [translate_table: standard]